MVAARIRRCVGLHGTGHEPASNIIDDGGDLLVFELGAKARHRCAGAPVRDRHDHPVSRQFGAGNLGREVAWRGRQGVPPPDGTFAVVSVANAAGFLVDA